MTTVNPSGVPIPTPGRIVLYQVQGKVLPAIVESATGLVVNLVCFDSSEHPPGLGVQDVPWNNVPTEGHWRWPDRT